MPRLSIQPTKRVPPSSCFLTSLDVGRTETLQMENNKDNSPSTTSDSGTTSPPPHPLFKPVVIELASDTLVFAKKSAPPILSSPIPTVSPVEKCVTFNSCEQQKTKATILLRSKKPKTLDAVEAEFPTKEETITSNLTKESRNNTASALNSNDAPQRLCVICNQSFKWKGCYYTNERDVSIAGLKRRFCEYFDIAVSEEVDPKIEGFLRREKFPFCSSCCTLVYELYRRGEQMRFAINGFIKAKSDIIKVTLEGLLDDDERVGSASLQSQILSQIIVVKEKEDGDNENSLKQLCLEDKYVNGIFRSTQLEVFEEIISKSSWNNSNNKNKSCSDNLDESSRVEDNIEDKDLVNEVEVPNVMPSKTSPSSQKSVKRRLSFSIRPSSLVQTTPALKEIVQPTELFTIENKTKKKKKRKKRKKLIETDENNCGESSNNIETCDNDESASKDSFYGLFNIEENYESNLECNNLKITSKNSFYNLFDLNENSESHKESCLDEDLNPEDKKIKKKKRKKKYEASDSDENKKFKNYNRNYESYESQSMFQATNTNVDIITAAANIHLEKLMQEAGSSSDSDFDDDYY